MILTVYNFCNAGPLMRRMYFLGGGIAFHLWASLVDQSVKNLLAMQETWLRFLGYEDPLEKKMAIHSSILAWKISWTEEPRGLQSMGPQDLATKPPPMKSEGGRESWEA